MELLFYLKRQLRDCSGQSVVNEHPNETANNLVCLPNRDLLFEKCLFVLVKG